MLSRFVSRPLYLTPEFFANKPLALLIGPGITAEMLNDDSLGRALDGLFEAGLTEIFAYVASHALRCYGIEHRFIHVDISSFRVIMTWCIGGNCSRRHHLALEEGVMITRNLSRARSLSGR
jgi:transposase